jgi:lysozyme
MSMKNRAVKALAAVLLAAVVMAGCGKSSESATDTFQFGDTTYEYVDGIDRNEYDSSKFSVENGRSVYSEGKTYTGVDVSSFQDDIDWERVAADGIDFAMIRIAYRGYSEGELYYDNRYIQNIKGAYEAGLKVGVYFYSQAISEEEALEEAEYVLDALEPYKKMITFPVVYDWEHSSEGGRTYGLEGSTITTCMKAFCEAMEDEGYVPMIYLGRYMAYEEIDLTEINDYDWWLAEWYLDSGYNSPSFVYRFEMVQYSATGTVDGIATEVDMNLAFGDLG